MPQENWIRKEVSKMLHKPTPEERRENVGLNT
jgi:hypothetical protein